MMNKNFFFALFAVTAAAFLFGGADVALADGVPQDYAIGMQDAASTSADRIHQFHDLLLYIISGIVAFVFVLLLIVMLWFNAKANPTPSKVTHNVLLEVVWTVIPVVILIVIAVPSFKLLYANDKLADPEMTIKATGHQWYWDYEYPDQEGIAFTSLMVPEGELKPGQERLLSTDNPVVLPVDTNIAILTASADVIHSWAIPAFGVKIDAVPGRTNETWFRITEPGVYYGQCSEICGKNHAYMPIEIHAVSKEEFAAWVQEAKVKFASGERSIDKALRFAGQDDSAAAVKTASSFAPAAE
ncbi:MAG: cytochrome c oxidase subunit II [Alphaproteobacteria bacterium]|nr:cytochrome c oxidase subunit II [Alphaproteobacteria bacterium]